MSNRIRGGIAALVMALNLSGCAAQHAAENPEPGFPRWPSHFVTAVADLLYKSRR